MTRAPQVSSAIRSGWRRLRVLLRRVPLRTKVGLVVAAIAIAGLAWQHGTHTASHPTDTSGTPHASSAPPAPVPDGGANPTPSSPIPQDDPAQLTPDSSVEGARATVQRFATNFASPAGGFDGWYARIAPDLSAQLQAQYRLTDIRNVNAATVQSVTGPTDHQPGTMAFVVDYSDNTRVQVRVDMGVEGWKVINVVPVDATTEDPAPAPADTAAPPAGNGQ
jgi:hypothetical protein